jgi:hypothetical protein
LVSRALVLTDSLEKQQEIRAEKRISSRLSWSRGNQLQRSKEQNKPSRPCRKKMMHRLSPYESQEKSFHLSATSDQ